MADAAVEFLVNNLKDLLLYHSHLLTDDSKQQIENLETDLRVFKAFLRDSVKKRREDKSTGELVRSIRDVVYEVEDAIDAFVTHAMEKKSTTSLLKFWKPSVSLQDIGPKVEVVKRKVEEARRDFAGLNVDDEDSYAKLEVVRPPRQKEVVGGFTDVAAELVAHLTKETNYFDVVSLVGMFGLGKTTLALQVFNNPDIIYKFPVRIWLPISDSFSAKDIFLDILKEFTTINEDLRRKGDEELAKIVASYLEIASFLIVLNDVRSKEDWDRLSVALPPNNTKGKILITSRKKDVGAHVSRLESQKELRFFTQEESWELLRVEALCNLDCPPDLEDVGRRIAGSCGGLPLAIKVIGGILATKLSASDMDATKKEWEKVSTCVNTYLTENDPADRIIKKFIFLSYDGLPYHLRACFLYLGVFPEDYKIPATKLIRMWIAEGFIQQNNDYSLEECGEMYLEELVSRNLVTVEKFKPNGKVKTCRIHDALRNFCKDEARNENENFFQEIESGNGGSDLDKYRRLSIHSKVSEFISSKPSGHRVRSFICFSKEQCSLPSENIPDFLAAFKLLRVLEAKPVRLAKISNEMYQLVHARYISLSLDSSTLASKFSHLWNTQTLIIDTTSNTLEVKVDIWKLTQLRHFKTNASAILPKPSKDSKYGAELQTLGTISVESCTSELIERACNLKKLGIRGRLAMFLEGKVGSFDSLGKIKNLEKLKLVNDVGPKAAAAEGQLRSLPQPYQFPSKLRSLTLVATYLSWNLMSTLSMLDNLEVLKLKDKAFMGNTWKPDDGGFRRLEFLHVGETDLTVWKASSHHFPKLRGLVLRNCEKLLGIPIGLADLTSLQMVELVYCKSAAASARRIHEAKKATTQPQGYAFKLSIFPPTD
ncbi:putative late blight resistance protein homolog R1A-10 [Salvia hispanica]|uniref:putative late blight resistance protein homolog R1A-10 n=1 Tax=Salvia hispanica TaxID=49212 RepID=UPI002009B6FB|nr:putative late blight resistance protein homolog R1A-10 [Salvia hispanica]